MRGIFLAFVLLFTLANSDQQDESQTTNSAIRALVDKEEHELAFDAARQAAEKGEAVGHDWLGYFYEHGRGIGTDSTLAAKRYRIAAAQGENHARWRLGVLIDMGQASGSLEEAFALFEAAAAEDYVDAIVSTAVMHASGRGTEQDFAAALAAYMRAARMGDGGGIRGVGVMLYLGQSVETDRAEAASWFLLAAAVGNKDAETGFAQIIEPLDEDEILLIAQRAKELADELGVEANINVRDEK